MLQFQGIDVDGSQRPTEQRGWRQGGDYLKQAIAFGLGGIGGNPELIELVMKFAVSRRWLSCSLGCLEFVIFATCQIDPRWHPCCQGDGREY